MDDLIYVYCITEKPEISGKLSGNGDSVYPVSHRGISAIVGRVPAREFNEEELKNKIKDMPWLGSMAREHQRIIEGIMKEQTVIPLKLCTIFKDEVRVKEMIEENQDRFNMLLDKLSGKEEWGVKIYCDMEVLGAEVGKSSEIISELDSEIEGSTIGRAFLLRKKREKLMEEEMVRLIVECTHEILRRLKECAEEYCELRPMPKKITGKCMNMILDAAFLLYRSKLKAFVDTIMELGEEYGQSGFEFDYSGPWPPYNFSNLWREGAAN